MTNKIDTTVDLNTVSLTGSYTISNNTISSSTGSYCGYYTTDTATVTIHSDPTIITAGCVTISAYPPSNSSSDLKSTTKVAETKQKINPIDKKIEEVLKKAKDARFMTYYFTNVKEYVPGKVYEFSLKRTSPSFDQDIKIKTICDENDEFSLDFAFLLALVKAIYKGYYTPEGYVQKAKEYQYAKDAIKQVKYGKKLFTLLQEKEDWEEEQKELKKERHRKYVEKKIARKKRKEQQEDNRLTNAIKKAIKED